VHLKQHMEKFQMWDQHLNLSINHGNWSELLFLLEAHKRHGVTPFALPDKY